MFIKKASDEQPKQTDGGAKPSWQLLVFPGVDDKQIGRVEEGAKEVECSG